MGELNVPQGSKRNLVRQEVAIKDGTKRAVFHQKKTNGPEYANRKELWDLFNKSPKKNSKRQKRLMGE